MAIAPVPAPATPKFAVKLMVIYGTTNSSPEWLLTQCQLAHQNGASHVAWWLREGVLEFQRRDILDQLVRMQRALHRTRARLNPTAKPQTLT